MGLEDLERQHLIMRWRSDLEVVAQPHEVVQDVPNQVLESHYRPQLKQSRLHRPSSLTVFANSTLVVWRPIEPCSVW